LTYETGEKEIDLTDKGANTNIQISNLGGNNIGS
jgi:hypothetical protein